MPSDTLQRYSLAVERGVGERGVGGGGVALPGGTRPGVRRSVPCHPPACTQHGGSLSPSRCGEGPVLRNRGAPGPGHRAGGDRPAPLRGRRAPASPSVTPCMCACVSAGTPRPGEGPPRGGGRAPKTKVSCTCRDRNTQDRPQWRVAWGPCRAPGGGSRSPEGPPRPPPGRLSLTLRHVQMELCHGAYVSENQGAEGVALCAVSGGHRPGRARPTDTPRRLRLLPRGSAGFCGIPCAGCVAGVGPFAPGKNHRVVDEFWQ